MFPENTPEKTAHKYQLAVAMPALQRIAGVKKGVIMEKEEMKKRIRSGYVDVYEGQTTDEDIQKGFQLIEQEKSIVGKITEEMISDGDDESDKLLTLYLESTPKERALLDCALIALCGWSLHTMIDMMMKPED